MKGTAVYFESISFPSIDECTFTENGPVFAYFEVLYSPYYEYFSDRTITYYDENEVCLTEFAFLATCALADSFIDFSHV